MGFWREREAESLVVRECDSNWREIPDGARSDLSNRNKVCSASALVFYWLVAASGQVNRARGTKTMTTIETNGSAVQQKTRELCEAILAAPAVASIRQRIDTFMADGLARNQYETLMTKGQMLQEKQQRSLPLSGEEVSDFETHREALLNNPVARGFLDAQEELHALQESIQSHVAKTLELGRLPQPEDFEGGGCGHGCGCHH